MMNVAVKIRKIGNSKGILFSNRMLRDLGVENETEVMVKSEKGKITITPVEIKKSINTDLSTWEAQFQEAISQGDKPETDIFEGIENKFDQEEW